MKVEVGHGTIEFWHVVTKTLPFATQARHARRVANKFRHSSLSSVCPPYHISPMALDTASGAIARRDDAANGSGEQHSVLPHLDTPTSFPFPYTPYQIQLDLMKTVFGAIEDGKIAIVGLHRSDSTDVQVSSPTGTGKSLTLLTSTLSWLSAHQKRLDKATEDDLRRRFKEDDPDGKRFIAEKTN